MALITAFTAIGSVIFAKQSIPVTQSFFDRLAAWALFVLLIALIYIFFVTLSKYLENGNEKQIKGIMLLLSAIYIAGNITVLYYYHVAPTNDSMYIQDQAMSIALGKAQKINQGWDNYFSRYANNNLLVLILSCFFKVTKTLGITDVLSASAVLNSVMIALGEVMLFLGVKKLCGLKTAVKFFAFTVLDPLTYLTVPWVYSVSLCLPLMGGILLSGAYAHHEKRRWLFVAEIAVIGILTVIGYFIRPVVIILFIGFCVCWTLWIKKNKKVLCNSMIAAVCCVAVMIGTYFGFKTLIDKYYDQTELQFPITHWIMMGLESNGTWNEDAVKYSISFDTISERKQGNIDKIKQTLSDYDLVGFGKHLIKKQLITWSDGRGNYKLRLQQNHQFNAFYDYTAGYRDNWISLYCEALRCSLLLLAAYALLQKFRSHETDASFLFTVSLFGAMLFYLIWEAKQSYSIPFLFMLYALAAQAQFKFKRNTAATVQTALAVTLTATVAVAAAGFSLWTQSNMYYRDYSVQSMGSANAAKIQTVSKDNLCLYQTFYTDKPFNVIQLFADKRNANARYRVVLSDQNKEIFCSLIDQYAPQNRAVTIGFGRVIPNGKQKYTLTVSPLQAGEKDSLAFRYHSARNFTGYDGSLSVGKDSKINDLVMSVFLTQQKPYITVPLYFLAFSVVLIPQLIVFLVIRRKTKTRNP